MRNKFLYILILKIFFTANFVEGAIRLPGDDLAKLSAIQSGEACKLEIGTKSVFLYFWASWCPDCRDKLRGSLGEALNGFSQTRLITVNMDRAPAKGENYVREEGVKLPVFRDESRLLSKKLGILAVPSWVLLSRAENGEWIVSASSAGSDLEAIKAALKEIKL